jgi:exodeoxyribonuclease V beta subunit
MTKVPFTIETFVPEPGISLIEASAGTGKTYSITEIVNKLIGEGSASIDEILLLTFSKAATQELKTRILGRLREAYHQSEIREDSSRCARFSRAIEHFGNASIFTLHGYCQRILSDFSVEFGLPHTFELLQNEQVFENQVRTRIIRKVQQLSELDPMLLPFCSWLGFGSGYIERIWKSRVFRNQILHSKIQCSDTSDESIKHLLSIGKAWKSEAEAIKNSLIFAQPSPLLKSYLDKQILPGIAVLDNWIESDVIVPQLFSVFEAFSRTSLTEALKKKATLPEFDFFRLCEAWDQLADPMLKKVLNIICSIAQEEMDHLKYVKNTLRYDDLLEHLSEKLDEKAINSAKIRARAKFVLVDEFQDTDKVQLNILQKIFLANHDDEETGLPMVLIGDPKQAIYAFRGGDIFTYLSAQRLAKHQYFLETNWRSHPRVNHRVNALIASSEDHPFVFPWLGYKEVKTAEKNLTKRLVESTSESAGIDRSGIHFEMLDKNATWRNPDIHRKVAEDISELLAEKHYVNDSERPHRFRPINASDIAVLVPDNRTAGLIETELLERNIIATTPGSAGIFESLEAVEWLQILEAIRRPESLKRIRAALATRAFSWNSEDLLEAEDALTPVLEEFSQARLQAEKSLGASFRNLELRFNWKKNLSNQRNPKRVLTTFFQLSERLLNIHKELGLTIEGLINWLSERISDPQLGEEIDQPYMDQDREAVTIATMHKSKGLQYAVVFIPFSPTIDTAKELKCPFVFHDENDQPQALFSKTELTPSIERQRLAETLSEKLRVLYVALTRAERACFVYIRTKPNPKEVIGYWLKPYPSHSSSDIECSDSNAVEGLIFDPRTATNTEKALHFSEAPSIPEETARMSFSSMANSYFDSSLDPSLDEPLSPLFERKKDDPPLKESATRSIFDFDAGTHPGLFFHSLLERIDFQRQERFEILAREILEAYQYPPTDWLPTILELLEKVASLRFDASAQFSLADIPQDRLIRESEFNFPIQFDPEKYLKAKATFERYHPGLSLPRLSHAENIINGYMRGVIDLWFEWEGKIYLIDWKSNWLGGELSDYTSPSLAAVMNDHHYHLQYLLYTVAIQKYLKIARPNFRYEEDFGGAYYVFLRGLSPNNLTNGIFSALPSGKVVNEFSQCLTP